MTFIVKSPFHHPSNNTPVPPPKNRPSIDGRVPEYCHKCSGIEAAAFEWARTLFIDAN